MKKTLCLATLAEPDDYTIFCLDFIQITSERRLNARDIPLFVIYSHTLKAVWVAANAAVGAQRVTIALLTRCFSVTSSA